jgi:hypothetical protein
VSTFFWRACLRVCFETTPTADWKVLRAQDAIDFDIHSTLAPFPISNGPLRFGQNS